MKAQPKIIRFLVAAMLLVSLVGSVALPASAGVTKAHPLLVQMAAEDPGQRVAVIVQKLAEGKEVEAEVASLGGEVTKDLHIINAFAAEMSAGSALELAASPDVRWVSLDAPVVRSGLETDSVADDFNARSYSNNTGTQTWAVDWAEFNDDNRPDGGKVKIDKSMLRLEDKSRGVQRAVNLQASTSATLTFQYRRESMDKSAKHVDVQVSMDGGATWTQVARIGGPANDSGLLPPVSFDLTPYRSQATVVRFLTSPTMGGRLWVDNLKIEYTVNTTPPPPPPPPPPPSGVIFTHTVADDLWSIPSSFEHNSGSRNWNSSWLEVGESDGGFSGHVGLALVGGMDRINLYEDFSDGIWNPEYGAWRKVDLSGATTAVMSFIYRRVLMENNDYLDLELSTDGGLTWTKWLRLMGGNDSTFLSSSFDISPFISGTTAIRFISHFNQDGTYDSDYFQFDDITIQFDPSPLPMPPNTYLDTLGVRSVWQQGITGGGITVAVIDSGIWVDADFMRLPGDYCQPGGCGSNRLKAGFSFNDQAVYTNDNYGHGTHVAGIIGGNGQKSGGFYQGVAPQVDLINLKVCDNYGMAYESDVVEAMQWVYENKDQPAYRIRIVNLSINSTVDQSYHTSPIDAAAEILWFNGVVVIASAGNGSADGYNTINAAPANDPFIITVGAVDEGGTPDRVDDFIAGFSAYGTTLDGFNKPDLVAPGKDIVSVLAKESWWRNEYPGRFVENIYFRASGTSMSAPMVTGAVALLLQDEPHLTPDQVKFRLLNTGSLISNAVGNNYPYLDVYAAVNGTSTESANTGLVASQLLWSGTQPVTWGSVSWNSVSWNSVSWNSVSWNSVSWNSVSWNSTYWGP